MGNTHSGTLEFRNGERIPIFQSLKSVFKGNLCDNGVVKLTVSSSAWNNPKNLIEGNWSEYWYSKDEENQWIQIEFMSCLVSIKSYSIKTYHALNDGGHLQSWILSGSRDGEKWFAIDEHRNDSSLNGKLKSYEWNVVETPPFKYYKLTQTERNTFRKLRHNLILKGLEFYGSISPLPVRSQPIPPVHNLIHSQNIIEAYI